MSSLPHVAFVAGTLGPGGAERQLYEHCRTLVNAGCPPVVLSLTSGERWEPMLRDLGVEVVWVGRSPRRLARLGAVVAAVRSRHVDVIQASHAMANLYAVGAGWITRTPSVGALRTTPARVVSELGRLGRPALRTPHRLAGNSRANLDAAVALGVPPDRVRFVPNVVDLVRFAPGSDGPATRSAAVSCVGRLGPEKRVDVLIEALARLAAKGRPVPAAIVGAGPLDGALRAQVRKLGLDGLVRFVGLTDAPERCYHDSQMLVLTSEREGTPNVVLEAMACGLPVVATPVGSVPELVIEGCTGHLVAVGDVDGLTAAIEAVLDDPDGAAAMGAAGRQLVEGGFDQAALDLALRELYRGLGRWERSCAA